MAERTRHRCEYCLAPERLSNSVFDVEHIQPRQASGTDDEWNLAHACRACNGSKLTSTAAPDPVTGHVFRLFNPRVDLWHEHFAVQVRSGEIMGRTEIGRATVARRCMNGPQQRQARRLWIYLYGYPADLPEIEPDPEA